MVDTWKSRVYATWRYRLRRSYHVFLEPPVYRWRRWANARVIRRLCRSQDSRLLAIGEALRDALEQRFEARELDIIRRIEARRAELCQSTRQIAVIDYGAGRPGFTRSREEMETGIPGTASVGGVCKSSAPPFWGTILFSLVRKLKPASCVELGACVGISAAYQAGALGLNGSGHLRTLEGSPEIATIARETLDGLSADCGEVITGPFHQTLEPVLDDAAPVDYFFNDGQHDRDAVLRYFEAALPRLSEHAVILVDDIAWSTGMREAWRQIERHPQVAAVLDLRDIGIAVMGKKIRVKRRYRMPMFPDLYTIPLGRSSEGVKDASQG